MNRLLLYFEDAHLLAIFWLRRVFICCLVVSKQIQINSREKNYTNKLVSESSRTSPVKSTVLSYLNLVAMLLEIVQLGTFTGFLSPLHGSNCGSSFFCRPSKIASCVVWISFVMSKWRLFFFNFISENKTKLEIANMENVRRLPRCFLSKILS